MNNESPLLHLWSDEPSVVDLLAFGAVADTVVDAVLDDTLDPLALGVSGSWGSGKTTVLRLVELALQTASSESDAKILTVVTDPWRHDPTVGAKESLIAEVLNRLEEEVRSNGSAASAAFGLLRSLSRRVDWSKALRVAARSSLTLQLPSPDDLTSLIRTDATETDDAQPRGLEDFRLEFGRLMASADLAHVKRLVVLVDDLDRCLPESVIETLETIRLFLAVPKMSFVIAADEDRVADAIRRRYPAGGPVEERAGVEEPAKLYLHKIVQTTIPIPALSRFDTEAYLFLLQMLGRLPQDELEPLVSQCAELRLRSGELDELQGASQADLSAELAFAARLTPLLYEKLRGNPRRIKRFLNDLHVRKSIAERRGIALEPAIVAKLMVLEVLLPDGFARVLDWLARNQLRERMARLEAVAGRGREAQSESDATNGAPEDATVDDGEGGDTLPDDLIRWAKLPPALSDVDLGPYLYLAAAFRGTALLDAGLPERLRDLAANLVSSVRAEQKSVSEDDLRGLTGDDPAQLVGHLARVARDRPTEQRAAVVGLLRITRLHAATATNAAELLGAIPADEVQPATVLSFGPTDMTNFRGLLESWFANASPGPTKNALKTVVG